MKKEQIKRLKELLEDSGGVVKHFADQAKVGQNVILDAINGRRAPRIGTLKKICESQKVNLEWLLKGTLPKKKAPDGLSENWGAWADIRFKRIENDISSIKDVIELMAARVGMGKLVDLESASHLKIVA